MKSNSYFKIGTEKQYSDNMYEKINLNVLYFQNGIMLNI